MTHSKQSRILTDENGNVFQVVSKGDYEDEEYFVPVLKRITEASVIDDTEEIWLPVKGFEEQYKVSNKGQVISIPRLNSKGRLLKLSVNPRGYVQLNLSKNGKCKNSYVHQLVARSFIPNPNNYPEINHINGIKTDNRVENLEWCTNLQNLAHARATGLIKTNKKPAIESYMKGESK